MKHNLLYNPRIKLLLITGLFIRVVWLLLFNVTPASDYAWYYHTATSLYAGGGGGYAYYNTPTAYWPIGYPLYLAGLMFLFQKNNLLILFVNVLLDLYIIVQCIRIAEITGVTLKGIQLLTATLVFYINHIAYTNLFCSEIPFLALLLRYCVYVLENNRELNTRQSVIAGLLMGAAILIKPIVFFFPLLLFVQKIYSLKVRSVVIQYTVIILCILPLTVRNYIVMGEPVLISLNMPVNLFIGNNPYANGTYIYDDRMKQLLGNPVSELEESKNAKVYSLHYIAENPLRVLSLIPLKIYHQYISDVDGISSNIMGMQKNDHLIPVLKILRWVAQFYYVVIVLLFMVAVFLYIKKYTLKLLLSSFHIQVLLYFFVLYLPFFGAPRFHYVMMPSLIVFIVSCLPLLSQMKMKIRLGVS